MKTFLKTVYKNNNSFKLSESYTFSYILDKMKQHQFSNDNLEAHFDILWLDLHSQRAENDVLNSLLAQNVIASTKWSEIATSASFSSKNFGTNNFWKLP